MARHARSLLLLAFVGATTCGCKDAYEQHRDRVGNGEKAVLFFDQIRNADVGTVPTGWARTVTFRSYPEADVRCDADLTLHCDQVRVEDITVVSAACDGDACAIAEDSIGSNGFVRFSSERRADTRLTITVRREDGSTLTDSLLVRFAPAKRIRLESSARYLPLLHHALVPGLVVEAPTAEVVDADDQPMSIGAGALTFEVTGSALTEKDDAGWYTSAVPGRSTFTWSLPGVLERRLDIDVIDPKDVIALFAVTPIDTKKSRIDHDAPSALDEPSPLEELTIPSQRGEATLLVRGRLASGAAAIVAPTDAHTGIGSRARASISVLKDHDDVRVTDALTVEDGSLVVEAASSTMTLPYRVTAAP